MAFDPAPIQQPALDSNNKFYQPWVAWFSKITNLISILRQDGTIEPIQIDDSKAANNSIYYSTTSGKLVYKDASGIVNDLY